MIFKSPGVYTQEKDVSGYYVNKNQLRRVNIIKIFSLDIVRDIYAFNYGSNHSFKLR
jgi:hypothetical protein